MLIQNNEFFSQRAKRFIPGGAHTYSKGDDQFPNNAPAMIDHGDGCFIWDAEGNKFTDFALSLGTVSLGHAYEPVLEAVRKELVKGVNFVRASPIEGELAELLCDIIPCADMVKLAKHGSDTTTGAIKLARAYTGREHVIRCSADPFNAVHDWFIGSTVVNRGVPEGVKALTHLFEYNNINSLQIVFDEYPEQVACVIFEPISFIEPESGFLQAVKDLCEARGAVLIFDEVVSGFRFSLGGAQHYSGVTPHLAAFGKAMANGFSVSALAGRKDIMELGGIDHNAERVFLLSTTHGGETHAIAAALATINIMKQQAVADHGWHIGQYIQTGIANVVKSAGLDNFFKVTGFACKPAILTLGEDGLHSNQVRTLYLQETIKQGLMLPYIAPCFSHTEAIVDQAMDKMASAFQQIAKVLLQGNINEAIKGDIVKPVFRRFN